jgi:hypothetical protein
MKLQALMIAVALAAGTAFAQAPNTTAKPAESSTLSAGETMDKAPAKVHKKKVAKKKVHKQHASAKHHRQHAGMHSSTHAMGAGRGGPATDLDAKARQDRMDQAYANWQAKR